MVKGDDNGQNWVSWDTYDIARLALHRYGKHKGLCPARFGFRLCRCGLNDALYRNGMAWRRGDLVCRCGRGQSITDDTGRNGVSTNEAERVGWRQIRGRWECPQCTGNLGILWKVFDSAEDSEGSAR
mgnify:CR=1 FL=1